MLPVPGAPAAPKQQMLFAGQSFSLSQNIRMPPKPTDEPSQSDLKTSELRITPSGIGTSQQTFASTLVLGLPLQFTVG